MDIPLDLLLSLLLDQEEVEAVQHLVAGIRSDRHAAEEIVDLVVTTAWYHLCAVILGSTQVELESTSR